MRVMTTSVLIAEDDALLRDLVGEILTAQGDFAICGRAADGRTALAEVRRLQPDVLLLDLVLPELGGLQVLEALQHMEGEVKVLVLSGEEQDDVPLAVAR